MTDSVHFLRDDNGDPLGVVSVNAINQRGALLAFQCAVASDKPRQLEALVDQLVMEVGGREAGYVCAAALGTVVQDVLQPLIEVVEAAGVPMRQRLRDTLAAMEQGQ